MASSIRRSSRTTSARPTRSTPRPSIGARSAHRAGSACSTIIGSGNKQYLAGDQITIADYFGAGLVTLGEVIRCDFTKYPNVTRWLGNVKKLKSWPKVNEVFYGLCDSVKEQKFNAI